MPRDGQADPEAPVPSRGARVGLPEVLEHVGKKLRRDALAAVGDDHLEIGLHAVQVDANRPSLRSELHGIGEQIPDDLLEPVAVASHQGAGAVDVRSDRQALGIHGGTHALDDQLHDVAEVDLRRIDAHGAGDDPADVEQVGDDLALRRRVPVDHFDGVRATRLGQRRSSGAIGSSRGSR